MQVNFLLLFFFMLVPFVLFLTTSHERQHTRGSYARFRKIIQAAPANLHVRHSSWQGDAAGEAYARSLGFNVVGEIGWAERAETRRGEANNG